MKNHKTRFIVFGQSRSGSTLLVELLNSHPDICCDGEIFNRLALFPGFKPLQWFFRQNPGLYVRLKTRLAICPVYGFKMFFFQVYHPQPFLRWLVTNNWKIIHVQRENILQQSLSNIVATQTNYWHRRNEESNPNDSIFIDPQKLLKVLNNRILWKNREKKLIQDYEHFTISYEKNLADENNWQPAADDAFEYLGLKTAHVETTLKPTYGKPYASVISNYDELMETVKNSAFAHLLEQV